uniref:SBF1/SBF2 domain-containing protein n=1 Tax=Phytophthora ramorum TaxID=164328 RepID=H3GE38_PHYRM
MGTEWAADEENHWRRTFCQVPFGAIYAHADKGKRSLQGLAAFFRRKAQAERSASEQLRELLLDEIGTLEEPGTGVRRALLELRGFVDASCRQQLLMAQVLDEQVAQPLESLQDASETYIQTLQGEILNADNEYEEAAISHREAAMRLHRATNELREARDRQRLALHGIGVPEFELQRLAAKVAKCGEEQARAVMARARAKTTLYNRIISRDEMTMAVSVAYQKAEEERLDQLNASLHRFLHVEKERLQVSQKMLASLETHVQSLSRAEDIQLLIHNQRDPDNMHFQGKALALLDWQWGKMQVDHVAATRRHPLGLLERRSSAEDGSFASPTSSSASTSTSASPRRGPAINTAAMVDYTERTSEELLQYVDEAHPLLHGGGIGRGATRTYLQEEVKKHAIWKTPSFWEKALLLAIGEELQRTPQPCPWEELPSGVPKHDGLPSREEAVCRVHNIVFGQLGLFTLSMLEFDVSLPQIESFVETMCDAHELTEDQRFLLRKNLQEIFATLR